MGVDLCKPRQGKRKILKTLTMKEMYWNEIKIAPTEDEIANSEPPIDKEVLCYGHGDFLVGYIQPSESNGWICATDETELHHVTHWAILTNPAYD